MRHGRGQFRQVAQLLLGQVDLAEQRIGEDLVQFGKEAILIGAREVTQIEVIGLRQPQQELGRHRALIALDQVDVAWRNTKAFGDLGLREPQLLPDPAKARPDKQLLASVGGHRSPPGLLQKLQNYIYDMYGSYMTSPFQCKQPIRNSMFSVSCCHVPQCTVTNVELEDIMAKTFEQLVPAPAGRFDGISRPYSPADVEKLRGSVTVAYTLAERGAHRLWNSLKTA